MSTTPRKSTADIAPAVPVSYAQAAKSTTTSHKQANATPKELQGNARQASDTPNAQPQSSSTGQQSGQVTDEKTAVDNRSHNDTASLIPRSTSAPAEAVENGVPQAGRPDQSSPVYGVSSASTLVKEDDGVSSQNIGSSESTWENRSQGSFSADKLSESMELGTAAGPMQRNGTEDSSTSAKAPQEPAKPPVNVWRQRAEEARAKSVQLSSHSKGKTNGNAVPMGTETTQVTPEADTTPHDVHQSRNTADAPAQDNETSKPNNRWRHSQQSDKSVDLQQKSRRYSSYQYSSHRSADFGKQAHLPSVGDGESWPTLEGALDGDKKRSQDKSDRGDRERSSTVSGKLHGKNGWVPVQYTPNVIFSTPLPNTTARRGGRGGSRVDRDFSGRPGSHPTRGGSEESNPSALDYGRANRREFISLRDEAVRPKRASSLDSPEAHSKPVNQLADRYSKFNRNAEPVSTPRNAQMAESQREAFNQSNRGPPTSRPKSERKADTYEGADRRNGFEESLPELGGNSLADRSEVPAIIPSTRPDNQSLRGAPTDRRSEMRSLDSSAHKLRGDARVRGGNRARGGAYNGSANMHRPMGTQSHQDQPNQMSQNSQHNKASNMYHQIPANGVNVQTLNQRMRASSARLHNAHELHNRQHFNHGRNPTTSPPLTPHTMNPLSPHLDGSSNPTSPVAFYNPPSLLETVALQVEYYFSVDNLCKDMFLRKHMDSQGFVFLSVIADFNRVKQLTLDREMLRAVCLQSTVVEYVIGGDGRDRLRRKDGWDKWLLPMLDRDPSVQNDGPAELYAPPPLFLHPFDSNLALRAPTSGPLMGTYHNMDQSDLNRQHLDMNSTQASTGSIEKPTMSDADGPFIVSSSSVAGTLPTSNYHITPIMQEEDSFSDEQIETLSIIVRKSSQTQAGARAAKQTNAGSLNCEHRTDGVNGTEARNEATLTPHNMQRSSDAESKSLPKSPLRLFWIKDSEAPVEQQPADATYEYYTEFRLKAINQRQMTPTGSCAFDMDILYQFWSHFLIRNFNTQMYDEFRRCAFEDASHKCSKVGLKSLIKFYGEALQSQYTIRERVARHYVDLVKMEAPDPEKPAFKQLRAAWRDTTLNIKNRLKVSTFIDSSLLAALEQ